MDDWIQKMWHIYTYDEILSAIRKDEILPFVTTWVDLGSIMLSCTKQKVANEQQNTLITDNRWVVIREEGGGGE